MADKEQESQQITYRKGKWWPASALLIIPFMLIFIPMGRAMRKEVNWKAVLGTVLTFEVVMFLAEVFSLARGHWVWNESRIFGYKIWGVPLEEPLLYYWFPAVFVITLFHVIFTWLEKKSK